MRRTPKRRALDVIFVLAGALALRGAGVGTLAAQERESLATDCVAGVAGAGPAAAATCREAVLALEALRAGVGLALAHGSDVPGFASTVGRNLGGLPRLTITGRYGLARVRTPALASSSQVPAESETVTIGSLQAGAGLGVLDGFQVRPGLGGIASLDLLGSAGVSLLPDGDGFGPNELYYGYGARLGILRESFSTPAVSVSIMRRVVPDEVTFGDVTRDRAGLSFDPSVTSLRATIGKNYLTFGVIGGVGFDRYDGHVELQVSENGGPAPPVSSEDLVTNRPVLFAAGQLTHLVFQMSLEVGWAGGFDDLDGYTGPYDPGSSTYFGNVAVRLTF